MQVPAPAGRQPSGGRDSGDGEPAFAGQGRADHDGHDCGRDHHSRAQFDQKPRAEPRPRNAPDEEREELVLRDESARGGGQPDQDHPHSGGDGRQCFRCGHVAGPAAWRRNAGVGRRSVSGPNRGDPRVRARSAGFHPAALSLQGPDRR